MRWPHPVQWFRDHPDVHDVLLGAGLTFVAVMAHLFGPDADTSGPFRDPTWWTVLLVVGSTLPVCARRRWPLTTASVVVAAQVACELTDVEGGGWLGVVIALYTVGAYTEGRRRSRVVALLFSGIVSLFLLGLVADEVNAGAVVGSSALFIAALVVGDNVRRRRQRVEELAERAERAERERELLARERVTEERNRIARELHDVVAHSVSVMVIQAAAARRNLAARPEEAADALALVESTGRATMDELRRVLGVLRSDGSRDGDELAPQPTLAQLPELVAADPDLPVDLVVEGPVEQLPPGLALSAYRVVQEALTNVRRHAGPVRRVRVAVRADRDALHLHVDDDGRGAATAGGHDAGGGLGLIGMRERVSALGGTFAAGPRAGGGWRVDAVVPLDGDARVVGAVTAS